MIHKIEQRNMYFCRLMQNKLTRIILILLLAVSVTSCSKYNQLLKSTDYEKMYTEAKKYYAKKEYIKAVGLFDELLIHFKADERFKEVYLMYAYSRYGLNEFVLASYHFKNFYESFPNSDKAEEALFMHVYCEYLDSYPYFLDPSVTQKAMNSLQLFINVYPYSERVDECNKYMDELRGRLRKKAYKAALLYIKMEDYRAATVALKNTIKDYPELDNLDEVQYLIIKCSYLLAEGSVDSKKEERLKEVGNEFALYKEDFGPENKYYSRSEEIYNKSLTKLRELSVQRGYTYYNRKEYAAAATYFLEESKQPDVEEKARLHYLAVKSLYKEALNNEPERVIYLNKVIDTAAEFVGRFGDKNEYTKKVLSYKEKASHKLQN